MSDRKDWLPPPAEEPEPIDAMNTAAPVLSAAAPLESARQFIKLHHLCDETRTLHHHQGTFYRWRGTHYSEATPETVRADLWKFLDGAWQVIDKEQVPFNPTRAKVANVLEALAAAAQLPDETRAPTWLDREQHPPANELLSFTNGLLHLPTRRLLPHSPAFFALNAVDYPFLPDAPEPTAWLDFLTKVWPDDATTISTLQELFGLLLTPDTSLQKAFLLIGPPRSGKGTIARVLTALLGHANVAAPTLSSLTQNFGLAPLIGKPLAIISDARLSGRADASVVVERLLSITGEDSITIDRKFRDAWTGRLPTRFLILTNELPRLPDVSGALASRFLVLVMRLSFFGREDTSLSVRLLRELPGILLWALAGYDRLRARGHFVQPPSGQQAMQELEDLASPIGAFIRERCRVSAGHSIRCDTLYAAWIEWCREQNRDHVGTVQTFGRDLRAAVPGLTVVNRRESEDREQRTRWYEGIGLTSTRPS